MFGYFDYSIDFHDTVTILHGLNGCGKTTMLQTINAVFNKKMDTIKSTDFQAVSFFFSTGDILGIERKKIYLDSEKQRTTGITYLAYYGCFRMEKKLFLTLLKILMNIKI